MQWACGLGGPGLASSPSGPPAAHGRPICKLAVSASRRSFELKTPGRRPSHTCVLCSLEYILVSVGLASSTEPRLVYILARKPPRRLGGVYMFFIYTLRASRRAGGRVQGALSRTNRSSWAWASHPLHTTDPHLGEVEEGLFVTQLTAGGAPCSTFEHVFTCCSVVFDWKSVQIYS